MNCAKCGREIELDQVFCAVCLEEMERYPVKPGTVVHIPKHTGDKEDKKAAARRRQMLTPEQQVKKLKRKVSVLRILLTLMLLLCGLLSFAAAEMVTELDFYRFLGKNYSTVETTHTGQTNTPADTTP